MNTRGTGDESTALDVEGTSYALLAHLQHGDLESSIGFVNWLNTHRSASGSFTSTQDTVVALQALSEFAASTTDTSPDLVCDVTNARKGHSFRKTIAVTKNNADVLQEFIIPDAVERVQVTATGTGSALLSVKLKYNMLVPPEKRCKFSLKIRAELFKPGRRSNNVTFPPAMLKELGIDKGDAISSENRGRTSSSTALERRPFKKTSQRGGGRSHFTYEIEVCTRYLESNDSNMAILDVGLFSGFIASKQDLDMVLTENNLIGKYEQTGTGIVFYLDKVPARVETCIKFKAQRAYDVGNTRMAAVKVYDYYNPDHSCTEFYGPEASSPLLEYVCDGPSCKCASAECPVNETFASIAGKGPRGRNAALQHIACNEHDFVWHGNVDSQYVIHGYRYIQFRVHQVIKKGGEDTDKVLSSAKVFVVREFCATGNLTVGRKYYIFGKDGEFVDTNADTIFRYPMNNMVRIYDPKGNGRAAKATVVESALRWLSGPFVDDGGCQE